MDIGRRTEFPIATYQLAEQYQVGQPLALYNMRPQWVSFCKGVMHIMLGVMLCIAFFCLVVVAIFLYQYLTLQNQHFTNLPSGILPESQGEDLQGRFILGLPGIISAFIGCFGCMIGRYMIAQKIPASLLVCTEGFLEIRPKGVNVIYWNEVRGTLQGPGLGERKIYKLDLIDRKPFLFSNAFEDTESLTDLVRRQIQRRILKA